MLCVPQIEDDDFEVEGIDEGLLNGEEDPVDLPQEEIANDEEANRDDPHEAEEACLMH